jgi:ferric enterobactin receptor
MQALEFETGYSRQGNLYAGDTQNTNTSTLVKSMYGKETNRSTVRLTASHGPAAGITA